MLPPPIAAESSAPSDWIRERYEWDQSWTAYGVGRGFEAYVRVFHPYGQGDEAQTWAQVAAEHGNIMHPSAWWDEITTDGPWNPDTDSDPNRNGSVYLTGELPRPTLSAVCDILRRHTTTPDDCYFAIWEGWGWDSQYASTAVSFRLDVDEDASQPPAPRVLPVRLDPNAPRLEVLHRTFLLYRGVVEQALAIGGGEYREGFGFFWEQSPTLMWPADHAWCSSTEIDAEYTVVGGSASMVTALVSAPDIEALAIAADAPMISTINQ